MEHLGKKKAKPSWQTVKYAFHHIIWPRRRLLFLGLFLIVINRAAGLVLPGASKILLDNVIPENDEQLLYLLLSGVILAILVQSSTAFFLTRLLSVEAQHLISLLRAEVQRHILYLPVRFFDNAKSGELVSRIMIDVEGVRNLVGTGFVQMFGGVLTAIASLVFLLKINAMMTLYTLLPLSLFGLVSLKAFGYIRPIFRERGKINAEVTGRLTESLGGIRVIKGFNAEKQEVRVFERGVDRIFNNVKKSLTATSLVTSSSTLLLGLASVGIMGLGASMIMSGDLSVGDLFAFTLYLGFLIAPIVQMGNIGSQITEAFAGLDRTDEILSLKPEHAEPSRTITLDEVQGDIRFEDVDFSYEEGESGPHGYQLRSPSRQRHGPGGEFRIGEDHDCRPGGFLPETQRGEDSD